MLESLCLVVLMNWVNFFFALIFFWLRSYDFIVGHRLPQREWLRGWSTLPRLWQWSIDGRDC